MKKEKLKKQTNFNTQKLKNNKAITLIALVVTIVVLLILAGISISLVVGDNGLIRKSKDAKKQYEEAQANELAMTDEAGDLIDETVTGVAKPVKVPVGTKASKNGTIDGKKGSSTNPTIPKNYTPIDAGEATWGDGTSSPTQNAVDHGLVIKDDKDNEWVWIPVPDVTVMCDIYNTTEYTLTGTSVKTKLYSKSEVISGETRTTPGTNADPFYREPDLVTGLEDTSQDAMYYKTMLGFDSKEQMAETFVENYTEMIESIKKYGGFYIGRYELSEAGVQKNQPTITKINWYDSYKKCQELKASEKVKTEMIWGCQWDATCNFIANKGDQKNIKDSSTWVNYSNYNTANNYTEGTVGYEKNAGSKQNTGSSENWKANNIYDFAGNCSEWTQEATKPAYRENRGGVCVYDGSEYPASCRGGNTPDYNTGSNRR